MQLSLPTAAGESDNQSQLLARILSALGFEDKASGMLGHMKKKKKLM